MTIALILEKIPDQLRLLLILMILDTNHIIVIVHMQIMIPITDHQINITVTTLDVTCILTMNTHAPQLNITHVINLPHVSMIIHVHHPIPHQIITHGPMHRHIQIKIIDLARLQDMTPDRNPLPVMIPDLILLPVIMIPDPIPLPVLIIPDLSPRLDMNPDPIHTLQDIMISVISPQPRIILDFNPRDAMIADLMVIHNAHTPPIEKILLTIRETILMLPQDLIKTNL